MTTALLPIGVLLVAFALSAALVPAAGFLARRYGVLDDPGPRKVHQAPTPRIGGVIREPRLISSRPPQYPPLAQATGVSGQVILEAHVSENGRVLEIRVVEGHALFTEAALASVRSRVYEPLLLNGVRSDFLLTITMAFNIRR